MIMDEKMINQNQIIDAVCKLLNSQGYNEIRCSYTNQRDIDIEATNLDGSKFYIEAEGGTSSKPSSSRYGKPFGGGQPETHVSRVVYKALKIREFKESTAKVGIAFPLETNHQKLINTIKHTLKDLGISIFWVDKNLKVISE